MVEYVIVRGHFKSNILGMVYTIFIAVLLLACVKFLSGPYIVAVAVVISAYCIYLAWFCYNAKNQELIVTPYKIYGRVNRKKVELPVDKITAVESYRKYGVTVATSSGLVTVGMCVNRDEVVDAISKLLHCRAKGLPYTNVYKLKISHDLFEEGTFTQAEYQEKERELLGYNN